MKIFILTTAIVLTSLNSFATAPEGVIANSVTQATLKLLNVVSGNTCQAPDVADVQMRCLGAYPPNITKPTIVGQGCFFSTKIQCGGGISANISGMDQFYVVLGPKNVVYDQTDVGLVVREVKISGLRDSFTPTNAVATPSDLASRAVAHPVVQDLLQLLNAVSGNTCKTPVASDVQPMCMGLLPSDLQKPTLVGTGCGYAFKIQCGLGVSADISGSDSMFEVMGPKNVTYDRGGPGLVVSSIRVNGL